MAIRALARAKINLALHVTGQRADGYHTLDSLVAFADFGDQITVAASTHLSLTLTGRFADVLDNGPDNLVLRAARLLDPARGAAITLEKNLPVASGIGGGSADAAATLRALSDLWAVPLPPVDQILPLGADVPVCLAGTFARMTGIGDIVTPLDQFLPVAWLVLVNCGLPVSTPEVFQNLRWRDNAPLPAEIPRFADVASLAKFLTDQRNDLELSAMESCPEIAEIPFMMADYNGCLFTRMSGSGGTCFGIFDSFTNADLASHHLKHRNPGWWIQAAHLVS